MYTDVHWLLSAFFIVGGLVALAWSSDAFVDGAAAVARKIGISPFIVGMVIIGFGTCAPEFLVSVFSGLSGHSNLSLGNAYGSCVFNIMGVLGVAALVRPLPVKPIISLIAAPLLTVTAVLSLFVLADSGENTLTRAEALALLGVFAVAMPFYCWLDQRSKLFGGPAASVGSRRRRGAAAAAAAEDSALKVVFNLVAGLSVMIAASHFLVWGSVDAARAMGVSELVIGLTIVAIGTSVPELASAVVAARKGEAELVLGNIVGSNLFNALVVVGTAGALSPDPVSGFSGYVLLRDLPLLIAVSASLFLFGFNWSRWNKRGVIHRPEAALWIVGFIVYMIVMVCQEISRNG